MSLDRMVGIFGLMFVVVIVTRVYIVYRKNGRLPVILNGGDTVHDFVHKMLVIIIGLAAVNIVLFRLQDIPSNWAAAPLRGLYEYLCPIEWIRSQTVQAVGLVMAFGGLAWSAIAQSQMGRDWRIGHDQTQDTQMVSRGLFNVSRHPIYLGFIIVTVGLFLAAPNALSLVCAALAVIVLSITARLEEDFMVKRHGEMYRAYLLQTRRWI